MKRTDLSIIMRTAWQMCRATGVTFVSVCIRHGRCSN